MIKVSVFYPASEGARFDVDYYCTKHMPLVQQRMGAALKGVRVDHGLSGAAPGLPPVFIAIGHFLYDSREAFQAGFATHGAELVSDVPNFTDIQPQVQISEVKL
jgi:uncharacterized protein (TIGR02118 family)